MMTTHELATYFVVIYFVYVGISFKVLPTFLPRLQKGGRRPISSVFMTRSRAQRKLLHTWIILVIVKQHQVQIGLMDGPTEFLS